MDLDEFSKITFQALHDQRQVVLICAIVHANRKCTMLGCRSLLDTNALVSKFPEQAVSLFLGHSFLVDEYVVYSQVWLCTESLSLYKP